MTEVFDYCHIAELTDKGCKRPSNEDWLVHFESPNGLVAVVCDGMGGHVGGQVASHTAVEAIQQFMMQKRNASPGELIIEAMNMANTAILNRAILQPELTGMGSTCVMLIVRNGKVYIGSVGDSRVYLIRNNNIRQLTVDQSYVQMLLDAGSITPEQAEHHPRKNEITNALGLNGMQPATVLPEAISPEAGDCFLLCSDGLSGMLSDREICKVVSRQSDMTQNERVEELVLRAKRNGGLDNITCQIVEFSVTPNSPDTRSWWKGNLKKILVASVLIIMGMVTVLHLMRKGNEPVEPGDNENITKLMSTADSIIHLKPMYFKENTVFMEIIYDEEFKGVKLRQICHPKDTTITIMDQLSLKKISVEPSNMVTTSFPADDNTRCILKFGNELTDAREIGIVLYGEKTGYVLIIKLLNPQESSIPADLSVESKANSAIVETEYIADSARQSEEMSDSIRTDSVRTDCLIKINKRERNKKITLRSVRGQNTLSELYFSTYAFIVDSNNTEEQDKGWYTIKNNGAECVLVIKNTKEHSIPPPEEAIIYIPTQPECNNGKGIIIRVRKTS